MFIAAVLNCYLVAAGVGCGHDVSVSGGAALTATSSGAALNLPAMTPVTTVGGQMHVAVTDASGKSVDTRHCSWQTADPTVLSSTGGGVFSGVAVGSTVISVVCGGVSASGTAAVASPSTPQAIVITRGGTYTGVWSSNDPMTPVVTVRTADPVVITNSKVTGKGHLIKYGGVDHGDLTVTKVTGIGLAPGVAGQPRGDFVTAEDISSLVVEHCTFSGVSFGVYVVASDLKKLSIQQNVATNLDDRLDNGSGGHNLNQRIKGHFIQLNGDVAPKGAEIAWNQIRNTFGQASIEDIINIFQSHGSKGAPIHIHDNYLEGAFASSITTWYSGGGIQMDGGTSDITKETGFVLIENNVVVRTANFGYSIGTGHDISIVNNRVVSCGQDGRGNWINFAGGAYGIMNYYQVAHFSNNKVTGNFGDLVIWNQGKGPEQDSYGSAYPGSLIDGNTFTGNSFDKSCWVDGTVSMAAEDNAWTAWEDRVSEAGYELGDTH